MIVGIAKGAGMIMPNMATMLCFILSDIAIEPRELKKALLSSAETTFNRISVDGDTSTNDTVLAMANGLAGNGDLDEDDYKGFYEGLRSVMWDLARMIVRDGEGATKLVSVEVLNASSPSDALTAARTVANSSLVKTALYGQDPNWGRIMAALGRAGIDMREDLVDLWIDDVRIVEGGLGKGGDAEWRASEIMRGKEFSLFIDLHQGDCHDRILTCDLTHEYVSINADYRT
ncbi:MAG TPA: bifunctional ornithine acetyltransferase/N-acetylglutamate synthase [Deltaproteobacteria bacterium]|nr:bifunctional ornithine acetyltransferase/N-acetylglutamate synthase [Deltaproteobacteria bacterium]